MARTLHRIDLQYGLFRPDGSPADDPQRCSWYLDIPSGRDAPDAWEELIHRVLYDRNVAARRKQPGAAPWYGLISLEREALDPMGFLFWSGPNEEQFPWILAERRMIWEPAVCYLVSNDGRYEYLQAEEFSELMIWRMLEAGQVDEEIASHFFDQYHGDPAAGARLLADREARYARLRAIHDPGRAFRRPVGEPPICSGPVDLDGRCLAGAA